MTYRILELLEDRAIEMLDLLAVLTASHTTSVGRINFELQKLSKNRCLEKIKYEKELKIRNLIHKLKSEGLITNKDKDKDKGQSFSKSYQLTLSKKGIEKMRHTRTQVHKFLYRKEAGNEVIIVSYDIPETHRKERQTIRELLDLIGFKTVHKSVWVGKVKLPVLFIDDLKKLKILDYVEIMKVTKSGSLKSV